MRRGATAAEAVVESVRRTSRTEAARCCHVSRVSPSRDKIMLSRGSTAIGLAESSACSVCEMFVQSEM